MIVEELEHHIIEIKDRIEKATRIVSSERGFDTHKSVRKPSEFEVGHVCILENGPQAGKEIGQTAGRLRKWKRGGPLG
jgi:hypothetical protein